MSETTNVSHVPEPTVAAKQNPSDEETAAIMAAMEVLLPRPSSTSDVEAERSRAWRFSGRWWARPVAIRRDRPYR